MTVAPDTPTGWCPRPAGGVMYAHNATTTLETQPGLVIITDRYGHTIHLSPTDATFIRQVLGPPDEQETP